MTCACTGACRVPPYTCTGAIGPLITQWINPHNVVPYSQGQAINPPLYNPFNRLPDDTWWTKDRAMTAADLGLREPSYTFWLGKEAA